MIKCYCNFCMKYYDIAYQAALEKRVCPRCGQELNLGILVTHLYRKVCELEYKLRDVALEDKYKDYKD